MTLEATIVVLDNTDFSRNGDHLPSRYEAQIETIQNIFTAKQQLNMENQVGIMTMGATQVDILITPSDNQEAVLGCLFGVKQRGDKAHFVNALQIAQLALKHRKNKNMRQRIIVFVASPIVEDEKILERVAKGLKKNNLSVDIVNLCQSGDNQVNKLDKFIQTVNSGGSSHFLNVPSGLTNLNHTLFSSPILNTFGENPAQAPGAPVDQVNDRATQPVANPFSEYGGVDPSVDPELAEVMKLSLEEEKRRLDQEDRERAQRQQQVSQPQGETSSQPAGIEEEVQPQQLQEAAENILNEQDESERKLLDEDDNDLDEDQLIEQAIKESQKENPFEEEKPEVSKLEEKKEKEIEDLQSNLMEDGEFVNELINLIDKKEGEEEDEANKDQKDQ